MLANVTTDVETNLTNWTDVTIGLLDGTEFFLSPYPNATRVMYEQVCETDWTCNVDQYSFKAYLSRWLAQTSILVPSTAPWIRRRLRTSTAAAAQSCVGGGDGTTCGAHWYLKSWDSTSGVGQALSAMEVIYALLVR